MSWWRNTVRVVFCGCLVGAAWAQSSGSGAGGTSGASGSGTPNAPAPAPPGDRTGTPALDSNQVTPSLPNRVQGPLPGGTPLPDGSTTGLLNPAAPGRDPVTGRDDVGNPVPNPRASSPIPPAAQVDVGAAGGRAQADVNLADRRAAVATATVRDPHYRWHNNHWWYRTNNGWLFWHGNGWRNYDRATYYNYYPRGWYRNDYYVRPYRSSYRTPGYSFNYGYYPGFGYGRSYGPYGWSRGYNRGWYDGGARYGGRAYRRW